MRLRCSLGGGVLLCAAAAIALAGPRAAAAFTCSPPADAAACAALGDLYASADGARWAVSGGWALAAAGVGADVCSFAGVGCSATGHVTSLCVRPCAPRGFALLTRRCPLRSLPSSLLSGTLPPSLGNLSSLTALILHDNYLAGTLPEALARLQASLQALDVSGNHFTGALPAALAPLLGSLSSVSLANNYFDPASVAPALCGFACNATAADASFMCPSAALSAACPACAAAPPRCQPRCPLPVNISSWPASTAAACSGIVHACDSCIPALQAPLRAFTADAATIATCIAQFTPELLAVDISASTLNALGLCAPVSAAPLVQPCTLSLPNAAASFATAAATCAAQPNDVCGACYAALAAPFLAAGATPATLSVCFAAYSSAASAAGVPMLQLSACAANAAGPARQQAATVNVVGAAVGGSLGGAAVLALALTLLFVLQRRRHAAAERAKAVLAIDNAAPAWHAVVASEADIQLGALLGSGGFASVYEARWQGTVVAVKVFAPNAPLDDSSESGELTDASVPDRSFLREVELLSKLRHPNILAIYAFVPGPRAMLVMELGSLGTLKALLLRCTLDQLLWAARTTIGAGVAGGLAFLHSQTPPILHGDLRSAKVAVDSALTPKVCDFGIRLQDKRGRSPPDFTNDCFGLGLVLLDLAHINTAHELARAPPAAEVEAQVAGCEVVVQAHVPQAFASVVVACTAQLPSARPTAQQAQEMLDDARRGLSGGSQSDRSSHEFTRQSYYGRPTTSTAQRPSAGR